MGVSGGSSGSVVLMIFWVNGSVVVIGGLRVDQCAALTVSLGYQEAREVQRTFVIMEPVPC